MNLTLSLGGGNGGKKRKVRDGVGDVAGGAMHGSAGDGGDRGRAMTRLRQARDRMVKVEFDRDGEDDDDARGGGGLQLIHLLLSSVAAAEVGDMAAAAVALREVYRYASFRGADPVQRVAAYFADALASRLLQSPAVASLPPTATTRADQFLALTMFYQASPFYQFAHFTANQAILEAFEDGGRRCLHVVDFDVSFGFQWPSLIQSLSDAATNSRSQSHDSGDCEEAPVSLRITGFGTSADELRDTEARLARFAAGCPNLRFEFEGVVKNGPDHRHDRIKIDSAATVVVNLVLPATQNATTSSGEAISTLAYVRSLNPSLVFLIEKEEGSSSSSNGENTASLLPRFAASLGYFAAVFESLHDCLPADSTERLAIERDHLGMEISSAMASLDGRRGWTAPALETHQRGGYGRAADQSSWKEGMDGAGFEGVRLSSRNVSQAKLLLKMKSGGFRVIEGVDGDRAMSLGWRDRPLITASGWRPCRRSISKDDL